MIFRNPMRCIALCLLLAAVLLGGCLPTPMTPERLVYPELDFRLPEVEKLVLPNGIRLYLKEDRDLPLVQVTAMIGSGAIATPADKTGFDQLFGAAWRTGGAGERTPEEFDERLDQLAAELGASLGPYTAQLDMSLRSDDLREGLEILADLLRRARFAEERLELARIQAQEQVRRQNDDPGSIARRLLMPALYPDHYLGRTPTIDSLAAVTRDDLLAFHREHVAPDNLWLAVSGDFDREALLGLLDATLGDWPRRDVPAQLIPTPAAAGPGLVRVASKELAQTTILIGDIGLTKDHPDQYAVRVLNYILGGGGFNSRLMREIRSNRGLAYSVYSYFQIGRRLPGPFVAGTETKSESVAEALALMREIMAELREKPVTEGELKLARESQINSFVFGFEDMHSVVSQQMTLDYYGYPQDYLARYRERIAAVTADDVQRVARSYLRPERQQIVVVGDASVFGDKLETTGLPVVMVDLSEPR